MHNWLRYPNNYAIMNYELQHYEAAPSPFMAKGLLRNAAS